MPGLLIVSGSFFNPAELDIEVVEGDARQQITQQQDQDLIFVDLFGSQRLPEFLSEAEFYQQCFKALAYQGILVLNLLPDSMLFLYEIEQILQDTTGYKPVCLSVPGYKNRILFSSMSALKPLEFTQELLDFSQQYQIDLNLFVQL